MIEKLEAATEGSQEIDLKVMKALGLAPEDTIIPFTSFIDTTENVLPDG